MNNLDTHTSQLRDMGDNDALDLKELFRLFTSKWYWFALGLACSLTLAMCFLFFKQPEYIRTASVLVKEDKKGASIPMGGMEAFEGFGLLQSNVQVQNELITIQSPLIIESVVRRLALNFSYGKTHLLRTRALYGKELPLRLHLLDENTEHKASFRLLSQGGDKWQMVDFVVDRAVRDAQTYNFVLGDTVMTTLGRIYAEPIKPSAEGKPQSEEELGELEVELVPVQDARVRVLEKLKVTLADEKASVINLSYTDVRPERAVDILTSIIEKYNELWIEDKNLIAISTSQFIDERLRVIERDLGIVDGDISDFKSKNLIPDIASVTQISLDKSKEAEVQLLSLNNQLAMARYIKSYLVDVRNAERLIPANIGIGNVEAEAQIKEYNEMLISRNRLKANSSGHNPLVADMDVALASLRAAIVSTLDNVLMSLNTQISSVERSESRNISRIASSPEQTKHLISIERQQKIKEALFLFLLQKREENQLSQAFTAYNTRIIAQPSGSRRPSSPVPRNVVAVALALGLMLPAAILFTRATLDTTLRGRRDTAILSLPYLGGIPNLYERTWRDVLRYRLRLIRKGDIGLARPIVVNRNSGELGGEAFRVLRTNVEMMLKHEERQVLMFTSFQPASGKTFVSANLAIALALKGKKVVLVDLDMRRASLSHYVPKSEYGLAAYLAGAEIGHKQLIRPLPNGEGVDIISVGTIPPNPAELLAEVRLSELIAQLRTEYDYIILDSPPVEIVADTAIVSALADVVAFVLRVGLLERELLADLEQLHRERKYGNMAYVLNGLELGRSGYGYGYVGGYIQ